MIKKMKVEDFELRLAKADWWYFNSDSNKEYEKGKKEIESLEREAISRGKEYVSSFNKHCPYVQFKINIDEHKK